MQKFILSLPRLSLPNITVTSTFLKLIEEISEAKEQIRDLNKFEQEHSVGLLTLLGEKDLNKLKDEFQTILKKTLKEIIDITQTCVSLLFVFEENNQVTEDMIEKALKDHLKEISYNSKESDLKEFYIIEKHGYKYMSLPTSNKPMDLSDLLDDIIITSGHYAQLIGKFSRLNGEKLLTKDVPEDEIIYQCLKSLIRISQNSYDGLVYLSAKYQIDIKELFDEHIDKLKRRKYL